MSSIVLNNPRGELMRLSYAHDTGGRRTNKTITGPGPGWTGRSENYGYDPTDQVTSTEYVGDRTESFAYDAMGNRTSATLFWEGVKTYSANALNQYTPSTAPPPPTTRATREVLLASERPHFDLERSFFDPERLFSGPERSFSVPEPPLRDRNRPF